MPAKVVGRCRSRALASALLLVATVGCNQARPGLAPRDAILRDAPVTLYPAVDPTLPPRAVIFFFGNDVGFWQPHQALAWSLSRAQFAVAGFDIRPLLRSLPSDPAARDSVAAGRLARLIAAARRELGGATSATTTSGARTLDDSAGPHANVPLILAGHSIGSELALWTAAHLPFDDLRGVLAMSPGNRSHLAITASDLLMTSEPTETGSFSVAEQVSHVRALGRVAIVRGERDKLANADPVLLAAGGERARRWIVPFSGHSLKSPLLGPQYVVRALEWLLSPSLRAPATTSAATTVAMGTGHTRRGLAATPIGPDR